MNILNQNNLISFQGSQTRKKSIDGYGGDILKNKVMSSENTPRIIASSIEEFEKIEKELNKLPSSVRNQIDTAEFGLMGVDCTLRNKFGDSQIVLPATTQISDFDEYIGIYCHQYFFRIPKEMKKYKLSYVFIEEINKELETKS